MLEDWSKEPEAPSKLDTSKPLIGLAISVCTFVVSVMVGFYAVCGPGSNGYNEASATRPMAFVAIVLFFASIAGGIGCFVWFVVAMILNSNRE